MNISEPLYQFFFTLFLYEIKWRLPVIYAPFLFYLALRAHKPDALANSRIEIFIYSSLNIFVTLVWVLIFGENLLDHNRALFTLFDVGAPLGMFVLLFVLPIGLIAARLNRKNNNDLAAVKNKYILASGIYYALSLLPSIWLVLFYSGLML